MLIRVCLCQNSFPDLVRSFASSISLSGLELARLEQMLKNYGGRILEDFTSANHIGTIQRLALFLHCADHDEIEIANAERAASGSKLVELKRFSGLGHRKVFYAPLVMRVVTSCVDEQGKSPAPFEAWQVPAQRPISLG